MEVNENLKQNAVCDTIAETPTKQVLIETPTEEPAETYVVIPPDGGWGWIIVIAAFFSFFISDGVIYTFGIFLDDMSKGLKCTKGQAAFVGGIMTGLFCFTGPLISALINKFGFRKIAIFGCILGSISCILTSISPTFYIVIITHGVLGGIGFGMIYLPAIVAVGFYFEQWRTIAVGIAVCGSGIGGIVLPLILTRFLDKYGWRYAFRIIAGLSFMCTLFACLYKPLKPICVRTNNTQKQEVLVEPKKQSFINRFSHPKVSDIYSKSSYKITENTNHSASKSSIKLMELSTTTLFKHHKFARNISSEFIMSSYPTSSSKSSFKSNKSLKLQTSANSTKIVDSGLSTVYEEPIYDGCCAASSNWMLNKLKCNCKYPNERLCSCGGNSDHNRNQYTVTRPLYRDDIFYSASLVYLPEYQCVTSAAGSRSKSTMEYNMFVTRIITQRELDEVKSVCIICSSEAVKRTLATMLDFKLLKSPSFLLLLCNAVFTSMGFYTPYLFIKDRAIQNGIAENHALWLIAGIGVMNTLGRIGCGILTSFSRIQAVSLSYTCLIVGGITTMLSGISYDIKVQFGYASLYGISVACLSTLRTIIIVEMLGLEKLTNAFGIILLFQGIAAFLGTSFSSFLRELTGNYEMSFYFAGGSITAGAMFLIPIKKVAMWEKRKPNIDSDINKT